jgi:hypothetical protein
VHLDAALGERERDPSGSDGEFKDRARAGKLGEEGDGSLRVERTLLHPLVVDLGEAVAVGRGSVLLDGPDPTSRWGVLSACAKTRMREEHGIRSRPADMRMRQPPTVDYLLAAFALLVAAYVLVASVSAAHAAQEPIQFALPF